MAACRRLAAAAVLLVACAGAPMRWSADTPTTLQAAAASSGVESPRRVAWLHVPKTGTSFATTLMHYANSSLPADARANNGGRCTGVEHDPTVYDAQVPCDKSEVHATTFALDYPFATWFQGSFPVGMESTSPHTRKSEVAWVGDHYGFGSESDNSTVYKHFKGSIFGMFRDPSRRAVSDYFRAYLNYHRDHPSSSAETDPHNPPSGVQSLLEHSQTNAGLAVRMLAAPEADRCKSAIARSGATCAPLDNRTLALARRRLKEGFAFIGDTDEWATSICLFHAKFGGRCQAVELLNVRPTAAASHETTSATTSAEISDQLAAELKAKFTDTYDEVLYADARAIFEQELIKYDVTEERCIALDCQFSTTPRFYMGD